MALSTWNPSPPLVNPAQAWLGWVQARIEQQLGQVLDVDDERGLDPAWSVAMKRVRAYALRPAKRLRPALVLAGYGFGRPGGSIPAGLWRFATGIELLHTFLLIHDDVADRAELRRGALSLHRALGPGRVGEDLAIVAGDHLFARSVEVMLDSGLPRSAEVTSRYLAVCRHTAVGQYLDLELSRAPLGSTSVLQALKVAHLKTARYGFVAPLVCGAQLGGASAEVTETLGRVGRHLGLAYQLRDDLIGLFGDPSTSGKPADSDFSEGKRTFPVIAAWLRASEPGRRELEHLWTPGSPKEPDALERARMLVEHFGGRAATQRAIERSTRSARRALEGLPSKGLAELLDALIAQLARRSA